MDDDQECEDLELDDDPYESMPESLMSSVTQTPDITPGIIYLSRIPPYMKPIKMRTMFSQFGEVGRLFLQPEDQAIRNRRKQMGGNGRKTFTEGWVEFKDKKVAKAVAKSLNNTPIGGKKRGYYHDDLWNIKYLSKFKWSHISEKIAYEKAAREQRMRTEIAQAKREVNAYIENASAAQKVKAMNKKRKQRALKSGTAVKEEKIDRVEFGTKYKQKEVVTNSAADTTWKSADNSTAGRKVVSTKLSESLLLKVFGNSE